MSKFYIHKYMIGNFSIVGDDPNGIYAIMDKEAEVFCNTNGKFWSPLLKSRFEFSWHEDLNPTNPRLLEPGETSVLATYWEAVALK